MAYPNSFESVSTDGYTVDVGTAFTEMLGENSFHTVEDFKTLLRQFELSSGSNYSTRDSRKNGLGLFTKVVFICDRKGFRRHPSLGLRQRIIDHTQCEAGFTLRRIAGHYCVAERQMVHNHELLCGETLKWHPRNRRLTEEERQILWTMVDSRCTAYQIRRAAFDTFGKYLTGPDVVNLRARFLFKRSDPGKIVNISKHEPAISLHFRIGTSIQHGRESTMPSGRHKPNEPLCIQHKQHAGILQKIPGLRAAGRDVQNEQAEVYSVSAACGRRTAKKYPRLHRISLAGNNRRRPNIPPDVW